MLAQVLKPIRCLGSRLAATQIGLKPAVDPEQHQVFAPGDAEPCVLESSLKSPSVLESALRTPSVLESALRSPSILDSTLRTPSIALAEKANVVTYDGIEDLQFKASKALQLASRFLPKSISNKFSAEGEQLNVIGVVEHSLPSLGACSVGDIAANTTVNWPTQQQTPWTDMYQAPEAAFHQAQVPPQILNGSAPNGFIVLQPMLMPVYSPFWGMQMSAASLQSGGVSEAPGDGIFPADAVEVFLQQCGGPINQSLCGPDSSGVVVASQSLEEVPAGISSPGSEESSLGSGVRRHRRSRRGGMAKKKSMGPDEIQEPTLTAPDLSSVPRIQCWADADPEADEDLELKLSVKVECQVEDQNSEVAADSETTVEGLCQLQDLQSMGLDSSSSLESPVSTEDSSGITAGGVDPLLLELEAVDEARREEALAWVGKSFWPLALTKRGCRIVQKAIDVGTPAYQQELLENLRGRVDEAMKSPHANYVLQKLIETMPPERMQFVLTELEGHGLNIARHRFGCRILQRLIEHSHPWQTENVINEVLVDASALCRHQYGNFVIQHILQHGSPAQRSTIADTVCQDIIRLAKHRIASHVVSCAMVHCPTEDVHRLTHAVLHDAGQLADLSRREYGSFVVREVNRAARMLRA